MTIIDETPRDRATREKWGRRLEKLVHLYRYRSLEKIERIEETVLQSKLYFPCFPDLNDPFDGRVQFDYEAPPETIRAFWEAHLAEDRRPIDGAAQARIQAFVDRRHDPAVHSGLRANYQAEIDKLGIVCFSEPRDNIPMWAYYASSQQGVCLRFRAELLLRWRDSFLPLCVTYVKDYPKVSFYRDSRFRRNQATLATKAKAWKHEREWRVVRERGGVHYEFDPAALDGIIVGCKISADDEARVRDMVARRTPRVELLKARPAERRVKVVG